MHGFPAFRLSFLTLLTLTILIPVAYTDDGAGKKAQKAQKAPAPAGKSAASELFAKSVRPFLTAHCTECHGNTKPKAGLNLAALEDETKALASRRVWRKVKENVEGTLMPPEERPQPSRREIEDLNRWIEQALSRANPVHDVDPGRVTIRRLNREEYNNTVRDLLGVDFHPADDFPSDDVGYGFDNIGDVLTIPPILMEKYLAAAETIAERAIITGTGATGPSRKWEAERRELNGGSHYDDVQMLASQGEVFVKYSPPRDGAYNIRITAFGQQAGPEPARMGLLIDGKNVKSYDVKAVEGAPGVYEYRERLTKGGHRIAAAFLNDYYKPDDPDSNHRDRNLAVQSIEVEGPIHVAGDPLPESHRRIIFRTPQKPEEFQECAAEVMRRFLTRAYRWPVTGGEVARLLQLVELARENGASFERGIQLAVQAALVSPQFLFRVELNRGRRGTRGSKTAKGLGVPLNDYEIASRLSYFFWSSMPDDELFKLAAAGKLRNEETLTKQTLRMLQDPKADALVENFAGQWLQLRNLKTVSPDKELFPAFDESLRDAMRKESEAFFAAVMREDKSILDFIDCDYTYLNERLARHYGIPGVSGDAFRRVELKGDRRGGLITQASMLTVTSNASRTSLVKRGKWVLEQILGAPPPPQPPDVPVLAEDRNFVVSGTLRQRLEQHRSNPSCASCHSRLDPLGFGLENYDAIGAWRDKEGPFPIDATGKLPSGESFRGPGELKNILKNRQHEFTRCLTEKLLTYALGRGLEDFDAYTVDKIVDAVAADHYKFSRLVLEIVKSDPFLKRRG